MIIDQILVDIAQQMTQFRRIHASDRDRVAVAPAEMLKFFDGVGECMAVVEEFTQARFLEVRGDVVRLDPDRALDQFGDHVLQTAAKERSPVECAKFGRMLFKDVQDFGVLDESRFGDLAQPFDEDIVGQRDECLEVGEHAGRRVERPDEVLALRRC